MRSSWCKRSRLVKSKQPLSIRRRRPNCAGRAMGSLWISIRSTCVEKVVTAVVEGTAYACAPTNKNVVLSTLMRRLQLTDAAAAELGYQNFLQNVNRKPYPVSARLQNLNRIVALHEPRVATLKAEDLIDDRFVRRLDESGTIDRLYSQYGAK